MPVYNTVVTVIACLEADSADAAVARLAQAVKRAGFEIYEDHCGSIHAFEAEEGTQAESLPGEIRTRACLCPGPCPVHGTVPYFGR